MRRLSAIGFVIFGVFVLNGVVKTQDPPPPPAPLIYSAPEKAVIQEFVSKDAGFSASFPGVPNSKSDKNEKFNGTSFYVKRKGSESVVNVIQYKENIESQIDQILEMYRTALIDHPRIIGGTEYPVTIIADRKINQDGVRGQAIEYGSDLQFTKVRLLFAGNVIFEVKTNVMNWSLLTRSHQDKVKEFEIESSRFFDSFKIIK